MATSYVHVAMPSIELTILILVDIREGHQAREEMVL